MRHREKTAHWHAALFCCAKCAVTEKQTMQPIGLQKAVWSESLNLWETKIFIEYCKKKKKSNFLPRTINYSPNRLTKLEQHQYSVSIFFFLSNLRLRKYFAKIKRTALKKLVKWGDCLLREPRQTRRCKNGSKDFGCRRRFYGACRHRRLHAMFSRVRLFFLYIYMRDFLHTQILMLHFPPDTNSLCQSSTSLLPPLASLTVLMADCHLLVNNNSGHRSERRGRTLFAPLWGIPRSHLAPSLGLSRRSWWPLEWLLSKIFRRRFNRPVLAN